MKITHLHTSPGICMEGIGETKTLKDGTLVLKDWTPINLAFIPDENIWLIDHKNNPNLQSMFYGKDKK